jgi:peptidoglycan/xylan/chitin deacetylase (PgdA/CDA1 family)
MMELSMESMYLRSTGRLRGILSKVLATKLIAMRNERPIVSFTFDNVPRSAITKGARILEKHGACGTFYIAGSLCGQGPDGASYFRAEDLPVLVEAGHEIGCLTFSQTPVTALNRVMLERENELNESFITDNVANQLPTNFAYPFGAVGPTQKILLQRRFASCRSTEPGINMRIADLGLLRAFQLSDQLADEEVITGLIKKTVRKNGWLIFYIHDVDENPPPDGCRPERLEYAIRVAMNHQADVLTVRNAIGSIAYGRS